jgi:hypothetical protein
MKNLELRPYENKQTKHNLRAASPWRTFQPRAERSDQGPPENGQRAFFESRFGHDFSHVRVHTDEAAAASARALSMPTRPGRTSSSHPAGIVPKPPRLASAGHELAHVPSSKRAAARRPAQAERRVRHRAVQGESVPSGGMAARWWACLRPDDDKEGRETVCAGIVAEAYGVWSAGRVQAAPVMIRAACGLCVTQMPSASESHRSQLSVFGTARLQAELRTQHPHADDINNEAARNRGASSPP